MSYSQQSVILEAVFSSQSCGSGVTLTSCFDGLVMRIWRMHNQVGSACTVTYVHISH